MPFFTDHDLTDIQLVIVKEKVTEVKTICAMCMAISRGIAAH